MIIIRDYRDRDAVQTGILIADTYAKYNLSFASQEQLKKLLGPFAYSRSDERDHRKAIAEAISSEMAYVAEEDGQIAGVLRGRTGRLASLFVKEDYHRQGIGRQLVQRFEKACAERGDSAIKVAATLYAVPFYTAVGYKKTTGIRAGRSFGGRGLRIQPMKKMLQVA